MQLPSPVRALIGLLATAADEAKQLPDRAVELPMLAVSTALQVSLRAQQRYAQLAARGDDVINRRPSSDEPPPWATFDDPISPDELHATRLGDADPAMHARAASQLLDELLGDEQPAADTAEQNGAGTSAKQSTESAAAKARKTPAQQAATDKPPAKKAPAKKSAATSKTINQPRHTTPSRFDTVDDD